MRGFVILFCILFVSGLVLGAPAVAQESRDNQVKDKLRAKRLANKRTPNPYWQAFAQKQAGDCKGAIESLRPLAKQGRGFENAQTALGECLLEVGENARGVQWINAAANAGHFPAQEILVELYAARTPLPDLGGGLREGAKWAHLYLGNPARQNLGVPVLAADAIARLRAKMSRRDWLLGKEQARHWTPNYDILPSD